MDPMAIIDSYVSDVVRYLPRRQRDDVALELRSLLDEELSGRAADANRPADATLTMELLAAFGRPQDVADRYRPAGFTIIRPPDAPRFAWIALAGIALIWAVTLPAALLGVTPIVGWDYGAGTWWGRLTAWWLGAGLGALWWPGVVVTYTLIAALVNHRRESSAKSWAPTPRRTIDRDLVIRPVGALYLALGVLGASVLIALPWLGVWMPGLPQPLLDALALDPDFLRWKAPAILTWWAANLALYILVLVTGRWSRTTLRVRGVLDLLLFGILLWWVAGGRVFVSPDADALAKVMAVGIAVLAAVDAFVALRHGRSVGRRATVPEL